MDWRFDGLRGARFHSGRKGCDLSTPGIDVNATDGEGNTALLEAARLGHDHVVRVLLTAGNMNARDKYGKTPLILAVAGGHEEVVAALKQAGARE